MAFGESENPKAGLQLSVMKPKSWVLKNDANLMLKLMLTTGEVDMQAY